MTRRRALGALGLTALLAGCAFVTPTPAPGQPVPALTLSVSQPQPLSGVVTVTATPVNFVPTQVTIRHVGSSAAPVVDTAAPFQASFDTSLVKDGLQTFLATGKNSTYTVVSAQQWIARNDPNVVVVYLDDLDETTSPYWDALPQTKALIADQGLTFSESFVTDPLCCPARASTLTGRYPHNTGVWDNSPPDGGVKAFIDSGAENDTVATRLSDHGYATAFVGKYLNGYETRIDHVPPGWTEWFGLGAGLYEGYDYVANHDGVIESYGSDPADYQTDVLAARSVEFLDSTESADHQPFFLFVSPSAPHYPLPPAPRHLPNPFGNDPVPQRPNFNEADASDKPTWLRDGNDPLDTAELNLNLTDYRNRMGSLLAVDDMVATLVSTLSANGELDDTVFVFTSDNGYNLGAHRLLAKQAPYEESARVPLVMSGPGIAIGDQDRMVTNIDLVPTVLELAGLDASDLDGRSLVPLLDGSTPPWRTDFLIEFKGTYAPYTPSYHTFDQVQSGITNGSTIRVPTYKAVRSGQWLYVEWYAGTVHEYELYDMAADPYQLVNLVGTPQGAAAYATTTAALQARVDALKVCAGPTCRS